MAAIQAEEEQKAREAEERKAQKALAEKASALANEVIEERKETERRLDQALNIEQEAAKTSEVTPTVEASEVAETTEAPVENSDPASRLAEEAVAEKSAQQEHFEQALLTELDAQQPKADSPEPTAETPTEEVAPASEPVAEEKTEEKAEEIEAPLAETFAELPLLDSVKSAVEASGYTTPTEIQAKAIPIIMQKRDVIGASQTGTGKTAAFALPSISRIKPIGKPQILVLEPTRELAVQVADQFEKYAKDSGLKVATLFGGVGYGEQTEQMQAGADIVVACPGRLVDMFYKAIMRFGEIKILILDEVDRMLDMGFLPTVKKIVNLCPWDGRQTLFFSATMPPAIKSFSEFCLNDPKEITVARKEVASTISHSFYPVSMDQRDELIIELLKRTDFKSIMIFTRTRSEANTVAQLIDEAGHKVAAMHSDIKQKDRQKALDGFKAGDYKVLVATDVAARGIDVSTVTHVINYRVPENPEDYVHRIGRTGRAKSEGDAFTLLSADELEQAAAVEGFIGQKIKRTKLEDFNYLYTALLDETPAKKKRPKRKSAPRRRKR